MEHLSAAQEREVRQFGAFLRLVDNLDDLFPPPDEGVRETVPPTEPRLPPASVCLTHTVMRHETALVLAGC